eukprot:GHVU01054420.1.p1 GENE.GHVU01054420.1~~GHVU01054420.1.p1  ORF type:complete len:170 (+),score=6.49 GHVU01054420.1:105-614(+)
MFISQNFQWPLPTADAADGFLLATRVNSPILLISSPEVTNACESSLSQRLSITHWFPLPSRREKPSAAKTVMALLPPVLLLPLRQLLLQEIATLRSLLPALVACPSVPPCHCLPGRRNYLTKTATAGHISSVSLADAPTLTASVAQLTPLTVGLREGPDQLSWTCQVDE